MNFLKLIFSEYKKYIIISFILFLVGGTSYYFFQLEDKAKPLKVALEEVSEEKEVIDEIIAEEIYFYVDLKGEVVAPGVYLVSSKAIVNDVIALGGGLTKKADTKNLNLSKQVQKEMIIYVASIEENVVKEEIKESTLININIASIDELLLLPGIGESKANAIIESREHQQFMVIEDIMLVSGIGEALFAKIKNYITV